MKKEQILDEAIRNLPPPEKQTEKSTRAMLIERTEEIKTLLEKGYTARELFNHFGGEKILDVSLPTFRSYLSRL